MNHKTRRGLLGGSLSALAWAATLGAGAAWAQADVQPQGAAPAMQGWRPGGPPPRGEEALSWELALRDSPVLRFDERGRFDMLATNNPGHPRVEGGSRVVLVPENRSRASGAVFLREPVQVPFAAQFEFSTQNRRGDGPWAAADGLVLQIGRRPHPRREALPVGGSRGFLPDGSGYGVHVSLYGPDRGLILTDGSGRTLASRPNPAVYTNGGWATLRAEVERDGIRVFLNGEQQIDWRGRVDTSATGLAVSAATGDANALHAIRDLRLALQPARVPAPPQPAPPGPPGPPGRPQEGNLLLNGDFEEPSIPGRSYRSLNSLPGWSRASGQTIELHHRVAGSPATGNQAIELDGNDNTTIYQDVATRRGAEYELRLAFSARPGTDAQDNALAVVWNGQVVARLEASGQGRPETAWTYVVVRVTADGPSSRLELRDEGRSNGQGTYVDDVSLRQLSGSGSGWPRR